MHSHKNILIQDILSPEDSRFTPSDKQPLLARIKKTIRIANPLKSLTKNIASRKNINRKHELQELFSRFRIKP